MFESLNRGILPVTNPALWDSGCGIGWRMKGETYAAVEAIWPKSPDPPLCCPAGGACCVVAGGAAAVLVGRDGCCGGRVGAAVGREGALRAGVRPRD